MTQFLLDTNIVLWYFWDSPRIDSLRDLITSEESDFYISAASWWEIAIKIRSGKLEADIDELRLFAQHHAFPELPITGEFLKTYLELPPHHKDPFDLMLVAQAMSCPMRLITGDSQLAEYSSLVMVV